MVQSLPSLPNTPKMSPKPSELTGGSFGLFKDYKINNNIINLEKKYDMGLSDIKE